MLSKWVKLKLIRMPSIWLILFALASLLASLGGVFPENLVERYYSKSVYPFLSSIMNRLADAVDFALIDAFLVVLSILICWLFYRRKFMNLAKVVAAAYLFFFWTWGLNYHRSPVVSKVDFDNTRVNEENLGRLTSFVAMQLNELYAHRETAIYDREELSIHVADRVAQVVQELDGISWRANGRVKSSWILEPLLKAAGVDGMFNPFGHEPLVLSDVLEFDQPMIVAHEMAHVRGYSDEGDANFVALMACVNDNDPLVRYSGWLTMYLYLSWQNAGSMLDEGPRRDLAALFDRRLVNRINWISWLHGRVFDFFLRANQVKSGIRSYSQIVHLALGTELSWARFAERSGQSH